MRIEFLSIITFNYFNIFAEVIFNHVKKLNHTMEAHGFVGKQVGPCSSAKILNNGEVISKTIMGGNRELAPNVYVDKFKQTKGFRSANWVFNFCLFGERAYITIIINKNNSLIKI